MATVKCKYCGKDIDREIAYSIKKGQYYCNENHYLSALEKKQNQTKHSYKSVEGSDRRAYTDAIQDLYVNRYGWNKNKIYCYTIQFLYDITEQEEMDLVLEYASQISIKHNFQFDKLELEE